MTYEDYSDQFGTDGIIEVDFSCKICGTVMSCNGVTIASHLLNNHKLTLNDYESTYLKEGGGEEEGDTITSDVSSPPLMNTATALDGEHFLAGMTGMSADEIAEQPVAISPPKSGGGGGMSSILREVDLPVRKDQPWYQKCKYYCQICQNPYFSISALRNHTKVVC